MDHGAGSQDCLCQPGPSAHGVLRWQITVTTAIHAAVGSCSYAGNETLSAFSEYCGMEEHLGAQLVIKLNTGFIIM